MHVGVAAEAAKVRQEEFPAQQVALACSKTAQHVAQEAGPVAQHRARGSLADHVVHICEGVLEMRHIEVLDGEHPDILEHGLVGVDESVELLKWTYLRLIFGPRYRYWGRH